LTPQDTIRIYTLNSARFLWIVKDYRSIEKGKLGDLLILNAKALDNIRNTEVIAEGAIL